MKGQSGSNIALGAILLVTPHDAPDAGKPDPLIAARRPLQPKMVAIN
jgi:hypothetical protein